MAVKISELASRCLRTEALFFSLQQAQLKQLFPDASPSFSIHYSEASSAVTVLTDSNWLWKLNHTVYFGIRLDPGIAASGLDNELEQIERVYTNAGATPHFNMCELADPAAVKLLEDEGYTNTGHLETFCKSFTQSSPNQATTDSALPDEMIIEEVDDREHFVEKSVEGFLSGGRPPELLRVLARTAVARQDMRLFFAKVKGEIIGCAGMAVMDIELGVRSAYLCIDSTLPAFRGRGAHVALLKHRLGVAKAAGCHLVVCAARQGSGSGRNIQRAGIATVYKSEAYTKS